jgi:hypothetical protein
VGRVAARPFTTFPRAVAFSSIGCVGILTVALSTLLPLPHAVLSPPLPHAVLSPPLPHALTPAHYMLLARLRLVMQIEASQFVPVARRRKCHS